MDFLYGGNSPRTNEGLDFQVNNGRQDQKSYATPHFSVLPLAILVRSGGSGRPDTGGFKHI